ncbi:hypothetical protein ACFJXX_13755, partial [Enterococcus faecalis]
MEYKIEKIYKYLFMALLVGFYLFWFSAKVNATDFEELVPEEGVAPYPASPYIDDNKEQWTIDGGEDVVPRTRARKSNWEYSSFKDFENVLWNQYNNIG